eukprot:CAMPEP_0194069092 /NCGR_PEP_ID=MMETSP0009_2-20130614/87454_1 /TAXON_ID=210454 /ORGANISM="Grammatophora oceanica, Strain CCMP 410" /LENGTH=143 /DNA_ID=CAMNT_0038722253 /DNA_START=407 /DNA_END=838 /DNA_ORIENTATION=+
MGVVGSREREREREREEREKYLEEILSRSISNLFQEERGSDDKCLLQLDTDGSSGSAHYPASSPRLGPETPAQEQVWSVQIICTIWRHWYEVWEIRNQVIHGNDKNRLETKPEDNDSNFNLKSSTPYERTSARVIGTSSSSTT